MDISIGRFEGVQIPLGRRIRIRIVIGVSV